MARADTAARDDATPLPTVQADGALPLPWLDVPRCNPKRRKKPCASWLKNAGTP